MAEDLGPFPSSPEVCLRALQAAAARHAKVAVVWKRKGT